MTDAGGCYLLILGQVLFYLFFGERVLIRSVCAPNTFEPFFSELNVNISAFSANHIITEDFNYALDPSSDHLKI